ncbi:12046_t:CDS:2 [Funneliformis mosseae]|uniref:12046_t:CDS:1 n=1 Tax=Funneliformis mosseae TaxID=27381 RepID=A0A9N9EYL2_FUNMO|nr:12046_t:CDS:2 [Funneliformis mosseae]
MPNNKRHTFKQIKNKNSIIHPSSRKAAQLQRITLRKDRLERDKARRISEAQPIVERLLWFRYALDDALPCATKAEVYDLIEMYIARNDDDISNLDSPKYVHKTKSSKQFLLDALKLKEKREYMEGFEIPNLMDPKNVKILRQWDGDTNSMSRIKTIRIEDPNNINNLKTTAQNLAKKQKSSIHIISNSAMAIDQTNMSEQPIV